MMKAFLVGLTTCAVAMGLMSQGALAATITLENLGQVSPNTDGLLLGPGVTETSSFHAPQSIGANAADPFGWDPWGVSDTNSQWLSVAGCCGGSGSYATFSFASPVDDFSLLWGSPNSDNTITLYSGSNGTGVSLATISFKDGLGYFINGTQSGISYGSNTTGPGDIISIISSEAFQSVVLTNDTGGFEVAAITATPLPPTWTMLLAGLAGLGFIAARRRKHNVELAAI